MRQLTRAYNINDLADLARRRPPAGIFEYIDRGAEDEVILRENLASIRRVFLRRRVAVDVFDDTPQTGA